MLSLVGFVMIILIIYLLLKSKMSPIVVMIAIPLIAGLLVGTGMTDLVPMVKDGIDTVVYNAILFIFSITFFSVMNDLGIFDIIVDKLVAMSGNNVLAITIATAVIAVIGHLDGSAASTVLITVPAMYPIYKKMGIDKRVLLLIISASIGVMNLLPWGGPVIRVGTVLDMEVNALWMKLIPMQIVGLICSIGLAIIMGKKEIKKGAGTTLVVGSINNDMTNSEKKETPKFLAINILITLGIMVTLFLDILPAYLAFMIGLCITLILNYPSLKAQNGKFQEHAASALPVSTTIIAAGVMVGVMNGTGMMDAMSQSIVNIVPTFLGRYIHIIFGVLSFPLGLIFGTDAFFYGLMPLVLQVGQQFGVDPVNTAITMLIGKNVSIMISPLVPAAYLPLGLVDMELGEHMKFSFKWLYGISIIMIVSALLIGTINL